MAKGDILYYLTEEEKNLPGIKLHLGCSSVYLNGWINVDLDNPTADVQMDVSKLDYPDNSVDVILASHIIEHFHCSAADAVLAEWYRVLTPGGWLITECPDIEAAFKNFLSIDENDIKKRLDQFPQILGRPDWHELQIHRTGYWPARLVKSLTDLGFKNITRYAPRPDGLENVCMRFDAQK